LVDVILPIADGHDGGRVRQHRGGGFRRLDPTHRFLVLQMPLLAVLFDLGDRPAPNLRADNAQNRPVRRVDGHERMNEEAQALRVASPAQIAPIVVTPGKVDLGRVLRHDHPPAPAGLRGASGRLLQNRLRAHPLRPQKAMRRNLCRAVRAKLARRQRARTRYILEYPIEPTNDPNVTAKSRHARLPFPKGARITIHSNNQAKIDSLV
jgi:hypothetical protein